MDVKGKHNFELRPEVNSTPVLTEGAAEVSALTEKTTPVGADLLLIEDSAASYAKKKLQITNLGLDSDPAVAEMRRTASLAITGTEQEIDFTVIEAETDSSTLDVDLTDNSITVGTTGVYCVVWGATFSSSAADRSGTIRPLKNGTHMGATNFLNIVNSSNAVYTYHVKVMIDSFSAGDVITFDVYGNTDLTMQWAHAGMFAFRGAQGVQGPAGADGDITWEGDWTTGSYTVNQAVAHEGSSYVCILGHTNQEPPNATYWDVLSQGINWTGSWSGATAYNVGDAVENDGSSYICISAHTNQEPPNATYWDLLASSGSPVFGSEFQSAASEGESSTTSDTFQQKLRLTTPSIPAGNYHIEWHFEHAMGGDDKDFGFRAQIDDTTTVTEGVIQCRGNYAGSEWRSKSGFYVATLTAAAHNIDLDYRDVGAGDTAYIRRARLTIWRVS